MLDTDWLVDLYIGRARATQVLAELWPQEPGVSIISHGELFEGAFDVPDSQVRLARVHALLNWFTTVDLSDPIMEVFGRNRSALRRAGRMIPDMDLLIASTAVHHNLTLLTRNLRHFSRIPDLQLYLPA